MSNITPVLIMMMAAQARKRVLDPFVDASATTPGSAISYDPARRDKRTFEELRRAGGLVEAAPGRYWYDAEAQKAADRRSGKLAILVGLAAAFAMTVAAFAITR